MNCNSDMRVPYYVEITEFNEVFKNKATGWGEFHTCKVQHIIIAPRQNGEGEVKLHDNFSFINGSPGKYTRITDAHSSFVTLGKF
jgi:hypothetical protein